MKVSLRHLTALIGTSWMATTGSILVSAGAPVIDSTGALKLSALPEPSTDSGIYVLVSSPGTPSSLVDEATVAPLSTSDGCLVCRGATLSGTSEAERLSLGTCSLVAGAIVVDGVTVGDLQAGLADSRHGRTLTALFRARTQLVEDNAIGKQTLILVVHGAEDSFDKDSIVADVQTLFQAVAVEKDGSPSFEDSYEIFVTTADDKEKVRWSIAQNGNRFHINGSKISSNLIAFRSSDSFARSIVVEVCLA